MEFAQYRLQSLRRGARDDEHDRAIGPPARRDGIGDAGMRRMIGVIFNDRLTAGQGLLSHFA